MTRTQNAGRLAGFTYLILIVFSASGYATMTSLLAGDPGTLPARLAASHTLFVVALAAMAIGFVAAWAALGVLLYRLMSGAGKLAGRLMLIFIAGGTVMSLLGLSELAPLAASGTAGVDPVTLLIRVQNYQRVLLLAQVFSGLWMFPFGWLVLRSRVAPRLLALCLIVGGFGYVSTFATAFAPWLEQNTAFRIVGIVLGVIALIGEFGMCVWLLVKGAVPRSAPERDYRDPARQPL